MVVLSINLHVSTHFIYYYYVYLCQRGQAVIKIRKMPVVIMEMM